VKQVDFTQLIGSLGFPITACFAMAYYVKYTGDRYIKQIDEIRLSHEKEVSTLVEILNNNTLAVEKLTEKLEAMR